jgi:hypothetical protein
MAHPLLNPALDYNKAAQELGLSTYERTFVERNRKYHAGDHWQGGEGYIGPRPDPDDPQSQTLWILLERAFISKNVVKEMDDRLTNAITGQQPDWNLTVRRARKKVKKQIPDPAFVPDPARPGETAPLIDDPKGLMIDEPLGENEQRLIDEGMAALYVFWDKKKPLKALAGLLTRRLWGGRSYLSQFVPPKFRNPAGFVKPAADFIEAIQRIFFREPDICDAVKLVDAVLMDEMTLIRYERGPEKVIETSFLDDDGLTFVGTMTKSEPAAPAAPADGRITREPLGFLPASPPEVVAAANAANPLPFVELSSPLQLNGHLTTFELAGQPFITPQIVSSNSLVNLSLTLAGHILVDSAFSELALTNVELETERIPDPRAPDGYRDVPKRIKRGGTVVHNFVGVQSVGKDGLTQYATPEVHKFEPTPITVCKDGKELGYRNCLEEGHQLHALISGDAAPSGESRIQALADFVMNALPYKAEIDDAGVWIIETALAWAAELAGKPGYFNDLRATFDCKIYVGKITPEERAQVISEVTARLRSRQTAMVLIGIDDPAAEQSLIDEESKSATPPALLQPGAGPGANPPGNVPPTLLPPGAGNNGGAGQGRGANA